MLERANFFQDVYNRLFLLLHTSPLLVKKETLKSIDEKVQSCVVSLGEDPTSISSRSLREIKVSVITALKSIDKKVQDCLVDLDLQPSQIPLKEIEMCILKEYVSLPSGKNRETAALANAKRKLVFQLLPTKKMTLTRDPIAEGKLAELKEKYREHINLNPNTKNLLSYLNNPEIIKLAKKIGKDMESPQTFQSFAKLISLDYKKKVQNIIRKSGLEPGADDVTDASLALILLQKNKLFQDALKQMSAHIKENPGLYGTVESSYYPYLAGISSIERLELDLEIGLIPETNIIPAANPTYGEFKKDYLEKHRNDSQLKPYLSNGGIKYFAKSIDREMQRSLKASNIHLPLNLHNFAKTLIAFEQKIEEAEGKKTSSDAYLSLILLQQNDQFLSALKLLGNHLKNNHDHHSFLLIKKTCTNYLQAIKQLYKVPPESA